MSLDLTPNDSAVRRDPAAQLALLLAKELWVLKDRQLVLEAVLQQRGIAVRELVDRYQPTEVDRQIIDAERKRFTAAVVAALEAPGDRR